MRFVAVRDDTGMPDIASVANFYREVKIRPRSIVTIEPYTSEREVSLAQMSYYHAVIIPAYSEYTGWETMTSELHLKRECSGPLFFIPPDEHHWRRGRNIFECVNPHCRQLMPVPIMSGVTFFCRFCSSPVRMFFVLSKTELTTLQFSGHLENCWMFAESLGLHLERPDPEWREKLRKSEE